MFWQMLKLIYYMLKAGDKEMAIVYATLIIRGFRNFAQVPVTLKEQVRQVLIELEMEELAVE